jgi:transposase
MFVPLTHAAGTAQADFGEALVIVGGEQRKAHYLAIDLPHSDDCFVMAFPAETTEAFLEGHVQAFAYFGGVPSSILYDNTKLEVARILGDGCASPKPCASAESMTWKHACRPAFRYHSLTFALSIAARKTRE